MNYNIKLLYQAMTPGNRIFQDKRRSSTGGIVLRVESPYEYIEVELLGRNSYKLGGLKSKRRSATLIRHLTNWMRPKRIRLGKYIKEGIWQKLTKPP